MAVKHPEEKASASGKAQASTPPTSQSKGSSISYGLIGAGVVLWSTIEVVSKWISGLKPLEIAFMRFFLASIVLIPFVVFYIRQKNLKIPAGAHFRVCLLGILGITLTFSLYHIALDYLSAHALAMIISAHILFLPLLNFLINREKTSVVKIAGVALGTVGLMVLGFSHDPLVKPAGIFLGVMSALTFALYVILSKKLTVRYSSPVVTSLSIIYGTPFFLPLLFLNGSSFVNSIPEWNLKTWAALLYLGLFAVGLAYLLYFKGLERAEITKGTSLILLKPVLSTAIAWLFLKEEVDAIKIVAIVIILTGLGIVQFYKKSSVSRKFCQV
ncbi:MAG: EamA family transporter [Thermoplasmata archaeon]